MSTLANDLHDKARNHNMPQRHRFSAAEYYQLGQAGVFPSDTRVELIEGDVIEMPPIGSLHADWVERLARIFIRNVSDDIHVRIQNPVRLNDLSEPEPDLALLRPRVIPYRDAHPNPEDVLLIVEVADTSLEYDRNIKVPLYARHGIPEVWLFDLNNEILDIYLDPSEEGYRQRLRPRRDEIIRPRLLPALSVDLAKLYQG